MAKISVLVSGGGTNLQALIDAEKRGELGCGKISLVIASKPGVYALERAAQNGIESMVLARKEYDSIAAYSKALADTQKLSLTVEGSPSDVLGEIKKIPGVKKYMKVRELGEKSAVYSVEYGNEFDIRREVFSAMARINAPILEMKSGNESLEDMFLKLTQGAGKAGR